MLVLLRSSQLNHLSDSRGPPQPAVSGYPDTWQLAINKGTTIVTFLMVFLVQHTQNRETRAYT